MTSKTPLAEKPGTPPGNREDYFENRGVQKKSQQLDGPTRN